MANRFSRPFPIATYSLTNLLCPPLCAFEFLYRIPYSDYFFAFMSTNESTNNIIGDQNPGQSAAAAPASTSSAPPPKRRRRLTVDASRGPRVAELKSAATKGLRNYIRALGCVGAEAPSESMMSQGLKPHSLSGGCARVAGQDETQQATSQRLARRGQGRELRPDVPLRVQGRERGCKAS